MGVTAVPAALSIASAGFSAAGSIMKGQGTAAADEYQAQRLEKQAEIGRVKAAETSAAMGEQLNMALGNVAVTRAAMKTDPSSPTTAAILDHNARVGDRQISTTVSNINRQAAQDESDAEYMRYAGDQALTNGYLGAAAGLVGNLAGGMTGGRLGLGKIRVPGFNPVAGATGQ